MRKKNPSYTALLRPTRLLISEKSQLNGPKQLFGRLEYEVVITHIMASKILRT